MKVGIISDTHDNMKAVEKAIEVFKKEGVDTIIHCGDMVAPFILKKFAGFKLYYVFGNNDGEKRLLIENCKKNGFTYEEQPLFLELGGKKLAVFHGFGNIEKTKKIIEIFAKSGEFDIIIYGHTHKIDIREVGKTKIINPGECAGVLTGVSTVGILDLDTLEYKKIEL